MSENRKLEGEEKSTDWECPQCTFQNKPKDRYCSMCVYDRGFTKKKPQKKKKIDEAITSTENETDFYYFKEEPFDTFPFSNKPTNDEESAKMVNSKDTSAQLTNIQTDQVKSTSESVTTEPIISQNSENPSPPAAEISEHVVKTEEDQVSNEEKPQNIPIIDPKTIPVGQPWSCPVCTYMNLYKDRFCGVCSFYYRKITKIKRVKSIDHEEDKEDRSTAIEPSKEEKQLKMDEEEDNPVISSVSEPSQRKSKMKAVSLGKSSASSSNGKSNKETPLPDKSVIVPTSSSSKRQKHHSSVMNSPSSDSHQLHHSYEDWLCPSCSLLNAGRNRYCSSCNFMMQNRTKQVTVPVSSPAFSSLPLSNESVANASVVLPSPKSASKRRSRVTKSPLMKEEIKVEEGKEESDDELKSVADEKIESEEPSIVKKAVTPTAIPLRETRSRTRNQDIKDTKELKVENTQVQSNVFSPTKTKSLALNDEGEDTDRQETKEKVSKVKDSSKNSSKKKKNSSEKSKPLASLSSSGITLASNSAPSSKEVIKQGRKRKVTQTGRDHPSFPFGDTANDTPKDPFIANHSSSFNPMLGSFNTGLSRSMSSDPATFQNYDTSSSFPFTSLPDASSSSIFSNTLMNQWQTPPVTTTTTNILPNFPSIPQSSDQSFFNNHENISNLLQSNVLHCPPPPPPLGLPLPPFNPMFLPLLQQTLANFPPLTVASALATNLPLLLNNNQNNLQQLLNNPAFNPLQHLGLPPALNPQLFPPLGHLPDLGSNNLSDPTTFLHSWVMNQPQEQQQRSQQQQQQQQQWDRIPVMNTAEANAQVSPTFNDTLGIKQVRNSFHDDVCGSTIDNDSASDLTSSSTTLDPQDREDDTMYLKTTTTNSNDPADPIPTKDFKPKVGPNYQVDLSSLPDPNPFYKSEGNDWNRDNDLYDVIWIPTDTHLHELQDEIPLSVLLMEEIAPKTRRTRARHSNYPYPELPAPSKSIKKDKIETLMDYVEMFPSKPVVALNTLYESNYRYNRAVKTMTANEKSSSSKPLTSPSKVSQPPQTTRISKATHNGPLDMDLLVLNREERESFKSALLKYGEDDWNAVAKFLNYQYTISQLQDYYYCIWIKKFKFESLETQYHYRNYLLRNMNNNNNNNNNSSKGSTTK